MANRGKKRTEVVDELPADKRSCSSLEFRPSTSVSSAQTSMDTVDEAQGANLDPANLAQDANMNTADEAQGADIDPANKAQDANNMDTAHVAQDANMEASSSESARSEGDGERESASGSYDSDTSLHEYYTNRSVSDQSKFKRMLSSLSEEMDESGQLSTLTELCELLSFCSDRSLSSHMVDSFSPILVRLARHETNPNIMLLAIRAITYLCDQHSRYSGYLVIHNAIPALCQKLLAIEYLDVAEQCLQALEKISRNQPVACLQSGAMMAVLSYIDFFSTSVQRVALSTVGNICKKLSIEYSSLFMEAVPILCNILQYEDRQLVESVANCLITIGEQVYNSPSLLDEICNHGLVHQTVHLIGLNSRTTLTQPTYIGLIGLLVKLVSGSTVAFRTLFELEISSTCKEMLSTYSLSHGTLSTHMVDGRHSQINEVMKLLNVLLPTITAEQDDQQKSDKEAFLLNRSDILQKFGVDLLPILIQVVDSGVNLFVCCGCLSVINKLVHYNTSDSLHSLLQIANLPSFLAGVFMRKDQHVILLALQIVDSIMFKLPHVYLNSFIKEGIIFAMYALLSSDEDLKLSPDFDGMRLETDATPKPPSRDVHRCPCFAFDIAQPEKGTCKLQKTTIQNLTKRIWATYFETESANPEKGVTVILQKLRALSTALMTLVEDASGRHEEDIYDLLQQIMSELNEKDSISAFEFVESGIIKALVTYLSKEDINNTENDMCVIEKRFELFGRLLLHGADSAREEFPLLMLIRRLQNALSSVENFPVVLNHTYRQRGSYASVPHERHISHQCLRVQFVRENVEVCLSDYRKDVVSVDPFVPLYEIEEYLRPRVSSDKIQDVKATEEILVDIRRLQEGKLDPPDVAEDRTDHVEQEEEQGVVQENGDVDMEDQGSSDDEDTPVKLLFYLEGEQLNSELTLYQSIIRQHNDTEHEITPSTTFWTRRYKITYRRGTPTAPSHDETPHSLLSKTTFFQYAPFFSPVFSKFDIEKLDPAYNVLSLLKILEGINRLRLHLMSREKTYAFAKGKTNDLDKLNVTVNEVPSNEFVNKKLTEKLEQQMRDPMSVSVGAMPVWCTQLMDRCPFLFGFEARCNYFHLAALGRLQSHQTHSTSDDDVSSGRQHNYSTRKKILVHRDKILESAARMMDLNADHKAFEVEYNEEVGTGLGPILEFYTLVCREFQMSGLGMWRDDCLSRHCSETENPEILLSPFGLFPRPWSSSTEYSEIIKKFTLLGYVVGKALQDGRVLDLPFSKAFYKLVLGEELTLFDIQSFDPPLGRALLEFRAIVEKKEYMRSLCEGTSHDLDVRLRNTKIEDLFLDFTLPGYPDYALVSDTKMVNLNNLDEYVTLVVDATTKSGIVTQVEAFKSGFNQVFPIRHLKVFTEDELERLLCGEHVPWNSDELLDHIKFDHGYTISSPPIENLLEIMQEFDLKQQRAFLQFVTGAPRLPTGGLASLNPRLTIVRKHCDNGFDADLPSVMTCANYLKLPPYSSKNVMKEKLLYAITEGQGSFHLS
ncbi:E3 ubiquitin-protein ligase upl4 [Castilleja foliolosa]|uniref:HECT-type E3 ubiquitin transferase n=1 Tax=Castilleja foliolosa TaxID=1961234 RepID=A0ABD3CIH4_9LAMI